MAPTPEDPAMEKIEYPSPRLDDERVVISGMSGIYPNSRHIKELEDIIYNKENPVESEKCRWNYKHPEVSNFTGKAPGLDLFDAQFFKVHYRLANCMDALGRKSLEQAYQAIYDAGLSPEHLSGKKVGVFIGSCFSETEKAIVYTSKLGYGFGITGCSKSMFANRISYWLNAKGPSMGIDASDCSGMAAMEQGMIALQRGDCEAALVGACNICLHPQSSVHYARIITMCKDGKTKSFDQNADGCAKSEAINMLLLQKAKDAKRIYAELIHVKCKFSKLLADETGPKFGFYRDPSLSAKFMNEFYEQAGVSPKEVEFVEAFGSAVPEADKEELESLEMVFCTDRKKPLLIGSVMSNIGYTEAASGISSVTKVLLGYQRGEMAANLHCTTPRQDIAALRDGRMQVVTDHTPFNQSAYVAINSGAVTGLDAHALLKGFYKSKDLNRYKCNFPRLVTISSRQDSYLQKVLDDFKTRPVDPEEIALFHNIHQYRVPGHLGRGYIVLDTNEEQKTVSLSEEAAYYDDTKRPLWFVYSGMGSQWAGMGAQLMRVPIFAAAIERCRVALAAKSIDIVHIITSTDKTIFDNILNSFVGIAAIQIGLTDMLKAMGLEPDKVIGHSVGELGCAYADGCFTAEEMILSAYSRGLVSVQTPFIHGSMAAVGIGYKKISEMVPPEIEVACHNSSESSTISGPSDVLKEFIAKLTAQGIFAKEVPCSNIAYHSRYIAEAGPGLLKYLSEVIKSPKERSERWVSTSVPQEKWGEPAAKFSSAEYHTNNLLNPVLFEETATLIPANAVLVEIAPHGLLQAILKRSLPNCKHLPLTRRGHSDNVHMVLDTIGKLFVVGYNPNVAALYPQVEFPVSTNTPKLSHFVEWAHQEKWHLPLFDKGKLGKLGKTAVCEVVKSLFDEEHKYLEGHVLKGKILCPFSAALIAVWDTLAMTHGAPRRQLPVEFQDVHLFAQPPIQNSRPLRLRVMVNRGNGAFEVMSGISLVATGSIYKLSADKRRFEENREGESDSEVNMEFDSDDIYKLLHERDHGYEGEFRSIYKSNSNFTGAQICWTKNWIILLDAVIQLNTLRHSHDSLAIPQYIRRVVLDSNKAMDLETIQVDDKILLPAKVSETYDNTRCGGILVETVRFKNMATVQELAVDLKNVKFVPHFEANISVADTWKVYFQIAAENINKNVINVMGIINQPKNPTVFDDAKAMFNSIPKININYSEINADRILSLKESFLSEIDLVLVENLSLDEFMCQMLYRVLKRDSFMINREKTIDDRIRPSVLYTVTSSHSVGHTRLELLKWRPTQITSASTVVTVRSLSDLDLLTKSRQSLPARNKLVILATYPNIPGLKDLVKQWRQQTEQNIYLVSITDEDNLKQLPEINLAFNVLNNGVWGGEYFLPCPDIFGAEGRITLQSAQIGDVNTMFWAEAPLLKKSELSVAVHYASLNNLDIKRATGAVPFKSDDVNRNSYAMDFSGMTQRGERVMGLVPSGAASSHVSAIRELLWPVPKHWTLEDAATVPSAYAQTYYILIMRLEILPVHSVLVYGGTGALGQAMISVALGIGCKVFTTVSDVSKKRFLLKLFPKLKEDHIGNSRDRSFADLILKVTNGIGVDVVVTGAQGELKEAYFSVCKRMGYLVDVDQLNSQNAFVLHMGHLFRQRIYTTADILNLFKDVKAMKQMQLMISEGIARGYVRPLSRVTYGAADAARAMRLLASSMHRGRVLLRLHQDIPNSQPRMTCSLDMCHTVVCLEETLGLQLADRLVHRGARKLLLHVPRSSGFLRYRLRSWDKVGVQVETITEEGLDMKGVVNLLTESNNLAPVEGVYVTLGDFLTPKDTEKLSTSLTNLDLATRKMCPSLKYFAIVSLGHSIGRKTCLGRSKLGLPATSLDLHALNNVDKEESRASPPKKASLRNLIDAAERAIRSAQPDLAAFSHGAPAKSIKEQIAELAEIKLTDDEETTYEVNPTKLPIITQFLKDFHNIAINEAELATLTPASLREIEGFLTETVREAVKGLGTFYSYERTDELKSSIPVVPLPTLIHGEPEGYDEFDVSRKYLGIVPGLEGHHARFRVMCEQLKVGAVVLQPPLDFHNDTVQQMAERYAQVLRDIVNLTDNFYLLGYEGGVPTVLEVAAILEEQYGLKGTIFLVGGTPEEFQATLQQQLSSYQTDEELQTAIMRHMLVLMKGDDDGMDEVLEKASTWKERIDACVRLLLGRVPHSAQYARMLILSAYTRIKQVLLYKPQPRKLNSRLILLHSPSMVCDHNESPASLLQAYSKEPIIVHEIQEPLAYADLDLRIPSIINKYLDKELLEIFETANLCEDYVIQGDPFRVRGSNKDDLFD